MRSHLNKVLDDEINSDNIKEYFDILLQKIQYAPQKMVMLELLLDLLKDKIFSSSNTKESQKILDIAYDHPLFAGHSRGFSFLRFLSRTETVLQRRIKIMKKQDQNRHGFIMLGDLCEFFLNRNIPLTYQQAQQLSVLRIAGEYQSIVEENADTFLSLLNELDIRWWNFLMLEPGHQRKMNFRTLLQNPLGAITLSRCGFRVENIIASRPVELAHLLLTEAPAIQEYLENLSSEDKKTVLCYFAEQPEFIERLPELLARKLICKIQKQKHPLSPGDAIQILSIFSQVERDAVFEQLLLDNAVNFRHLLHDKVICADDFKQIPGIINVDTRAGHVLHNNLQNLLESPTKFGCDSLKNLLACGFAFRDLYQCEYMFNLHHLLDNALLIRDHLNKLPSHAKKEAMTKFLNLNNSVEEYVSYLKNNPSRKSVGR